MGNTTIVLRVRATQTYTLGITISSLLLPHSHLPPFSIFFPPIPYRRPISLMSDLSFLYCVSFAQMDKCGIFSYIPFFFRAAFVLCNFHLEICLGNHFTSIYRVLPHFLNSCWICHCVLCHKCTNTSIASKILQLQIILQRLTLCVCFFPIVGVYFKWMS